MNVDLQAVIAVILLMVVIAYIANRYVVKPIFKSDSTHNNCGPDCGCDHS